jgi:hypothetical protein
MRAKNALISGDASWLSLASRRSRSRLLGAVTTAGPAIAAAWAFFLGARFGFAAQGRRPICPNRASPHSPKKPDVHM